MFVISGAEIYARGSLFVITGLDMWTYNFMINNKDMFTQDVIDSATNYLKSQNLLDPQDSSEDQKKLIPTTEKL